MHAHENGTYYSNATKEGLGTMRFTATSRHVLDQQQKKFVWITKKSPADRRFIWSNDRLGENLPTDMYF
ncbi:hypothetical protein D0469_13955 [Peribacillus saganii]|uniref:Uncharacterized protein n=1 Tax=Peribacillus saganii TaxID=2303992 RepID=A0A372LLA8_9BACI|nr:hypothetical protein D0469_13955 [Peribacillus saganii]